MELKEGGPAKEDSDSSTNDMSIRRIDVGQALECYVMYVISASASDVMCSFTFEHGAHSEHHETPTAYCRTAKPSFGAALFYSFENDKAFSTHPQKDCPCAGGQLH